MTDVGFGGDGPLKPLPLTDGKVSLNLFTQEVRLMRDFIPGQSERSPGKELWIYQYRNNPQHAWNSFYAFSELVEFTQSDCEIINWYTGSHPSNLQTFTVLIVKFLRRVSDDGVHEEVYGKRMLVDGVVKENSGGRTIIVETCETEAQRVQAIKTWFGISLDRQEVDSIQGRKTELRGTG